MLITTAINYTNGNPHIGHCYEAILTDFLARYHRAFKSRVFFQTGTDEHGQKIADRAAQQDMTPKGLCDHYAGKFQSLAESLQLSHDHFIRTTDNYHKKEVQRIFTLLLSQGDIYLDTYEGWYNVREETFVTDLEARLSAYKDPASGVPLQRISEPSYFFRLTKYIPSVLEHIETNPQFIVPDSRRHEIIKRLRKHLEAVDGDSMRDLSISRTTFSWGIPVPDDPEHCLYVWMDALFNYYTGPAYVLGRDDAECSFSTDTIHVIGKDILWFHAVIWPALLLAFNKPLPATIWTHDFVTDADGRKMSKSLGNVVEPTSMIERHGIDAVRFYLLKETTQGIDLRFNEDSLVQAKKTELAAKLGNLVNRILNIAKRYGDSTVPDVNAVRPIFDADILVDAIHVALQNYQISRIVEMVRDAIRAVNQDIVQTEIWKLPFDATEEKDGLVRSYLEALVIIAKLWAPINPEVADRIFNALGRGSTSAPKNEDLVYLDKELFWRDLEPGTQIQGKLILFPL